MISKKIFQWIKNPYILLSLAGMIWLTFFDQYSILRRLHDYADLQKLKDEKKYYLIQIRDIRKKNVDLLTDSLTKEKFAREHYFMKKDNEEVIIVEDNTNQ
jgi:hypothetical protein